MTTAEGILQDEEEATRGKQTNDLVDLSLQLRLTLGRRLILALVAPRAAPTTPSQTSPRGSRPTPK